MKDLKAHRGHKARSRAHTGSRRNDPSNLSGLGGQASILALVALFLLSFPITAQISRGGLPVSFAERMAVESALIRLPAPDLSGIRQQDEEEEKQALPRRVAVGIAVQQDLDDAGGWSRSADDIWVKKIRIESNGALALGLYFEDFFLEEGIRMFLYDDERTAVFGAYTFYNNQSGGLFATSLIPGDHINIEFNSDQAPTGDLPVIAEVSYVYRDFASSREVLGVSDHCEVNVNCPEGAAWKKQKQGVARIYVKRNSSYFWCTGSLVNNARMDRTPYLLTADHCAPDVSAEDLSQWVFYFNFEAPGCENPAATPSYNSLTGAIRLANASTSGSDFLLVQLNDEVPELFDPFYNGWSAENLSSPAGVTIHHPNGDIKKISTYTEYPVSSNWSGLPGTHWQVVWSQTETNWGVTEGGSSGAPLFDNSGRIIGTLTGGLAACDPNGSGSGTGPDKPDYFGKFSYSWDQNGSLPAQQLKPWLDPDNTGIVTLPGMSASLTALFESDEQMILVGDEVTFTNLSSGLPISWDWTFEGGNPASYSGFQPPAVKYTQAGQFDVILVVSDGFTEDTLKLTDYIHAVGTVFPNPARTIVNIFLDADLPADIRAELFSVNGLKVYDADYPDHGSRLLTIDISLLPAGIYIARLQIKGRYVFAKVFKI